MQKNNATADATPKSPRAACPPEGREPPASAGGRPESVYAFPMNFKRNSVFVFILSVF